MPEIDLMRGWAKRGLSLAAVLCLMSTPVVAQEEEAPEPTYESSPIVAGGWCSVSSNKPDPAPDSTENEEGTEVDIEVQDSDVGCDAGIGARLFTFQRAPRLSIVGAIGAETLGGGLALRIGQIGNVPVAIAAGAVVRYDFSTGIDSSEIYPVIGATLSLTREIP